jgi:hypothetical protein
LKILGGKVDNILKKTKSTEKQSRTQGAKLKILGGTVDNILKKTKSTTSW